jgi:hypothetical protein
MFPFALNGSLSSLVFLSSLGRPSVPGIRKLQAEVNIELGHNLKPLNFEAWRFVVVLSEVVLLVDGFCQGHEPLLEAAEDTFRQLMIAATLEDEGYRRIQLDSFAPQHTAT